MMKEVVSPQRFEEAEWGRVPVNIIVGKDVKHISAPESGKEQKGMTTHQNIKEEPSKKSDRPATEERHEKVILIARVLVMKAME